MAHSPIKTSGVGFPRFSDTEGEGGEPQAPDPFLRPVWEDNDPADDLLPSAFTSGYASRKEQSGFSPAALHPELVGLLADVAACLAKLETYLDLMPAFLRKGLVRRFCYREAAGWFGYFHQKKDPVALAAYGNRLISGLTGLDGMSHEDGAGTFSASDAEDVWGDARGQSYLSTASSLAVALEKYVGLSQSSVDQDAGIGLKFLVDFDGAVDHGGLFTRDFAAGLRSNVAILDAGLVAQSVTDSGNFAHHRSLYGTLVGYHYLRTQAVLRWAPLPFWALQDTLASPQLNDRMPRTRPDVRGKRGLTKDAPSLQVLWLISLLEGSLLYLREAKRLYALWEQFKPYLEAEDGRSFLPAAFKLTVQNYVISIKDLAEAGKVSKITAARAQARLQELGFITEVTGRKASRAFAVRGNERPKRL